ncbi:MAG: hypothetical protein KatS3mg006_2289 [Pyrinomonadaceae bacterium]|nr:MAG: hypothetical protein KatS3mg006_2289 [Pyrinomonadaceae bacterium]
MRLNVWFAYLVLYFVMIQSANSQVLLPVRVGDKMGYIDESGKIVVEPKFDYAGDFSDGLAPVAQEVGNRRIFGYINSKGEIVIPMQFEDAKEFSEGLATVRINGKYGYIDTSGKVVVEPVFWKAWSFSEGRGRVLQIVEEKGNFLYGFVDKEGRVVIKPQYLFARDFREGLAAVLVEVGEDFRMGFIDKEGRMVIRPKFGIARDFSEGLAVVIQNVEPYLFEEDVLGSEKECKKMKWAYINKKGKVVIKGNFQNASDFSEGVAVVRINNKICLIDGSGKVVVTMDFPQTAVVGNFFRGVGIAPLHHMGGLKFIDKTGKIVIQTDFDWVVKIVNGYFRVWRLTKDKKSAVFGYIDRDGNVIWDPEK